MAPQLVITTVAAPIGVESAAFATRPRISPRAGAGFPCVAGVACAPAGDWPRTPTATATAIDLIRPVKGSPPRKKGPHQTGASIRMACKIGAHDDVTVTPGQAPLTPLREQRRASTIGGPSRYGSIT